MSEATRSGYLCRYPSLRSWQYFHFRASIAEIRLGIELQENVTRRVELNEWLTQTSRRFYCAIQIHPGRFLVDK
jgi:hypothetical protein